MHLLAWVAIVGSILMVLISPFTQGKTIKIDGWASAFAFMRFLLFAALGGRVLGWW